MFNRSATTVKQRLHIPEQSLSVPDDTKLSPLHEAIACSLANAVDGEMAAARLWLWRQSVPGFLEVLHKRGFLVTDPEANQTSVD